MIYSNNGYSYEDTIVSCGQILPDELSSMRVMLSFPINNSIDHRYSNSIIIVITLLNTMYTYISYSIRLPVAIVDLVDADDVSYGEVFILDKDDTVANEESQGCTTVTLGFFHIEGIVLTNYCKYGKICWAKL